MQLFSSESSPKLYYLQLVAVEKQLLLQIAQSNPFFAQLVQLVNLELSQLPPEQLLVRELSGEQIKAKLKALPQTLDDFIDRQIKGEEPAQPPRKVKY
jgi:hypothetical protein